MSSSPTFSFETTADEVVAAFPEEIKGKNVLITGTSLDGLGYETARVISKYADVVIITGYNADRLKLTEEAIKKEVPNANIRRLNLDLSSLASVRKAAEEVNASPEPMHVRDVVSLIWQAQTEYGFQVLIHNAASGGPFKLTVDGLESNFGTNYVGPFLLTKLLTPKLLASTTAIYTPRVVFVASAMHALFPGIDLSALRKPDPTNYLALKAYAQAKSATILISIELAKRAKGKLNVYSLHPGGAQEPTIRKDLEAFGALGPDGLPSQQKVRWKTIPQGAATTVTAAFDPRLNGQSGAYLDDCKLSNESVAPHSSDPVVAEQLWTITEEIIGEKYTW
ncbi:NAD-P-binding protein [Mycena galericulata]|nr:NAD-P-binding protein [Mycena galericulata]